MSDCTAALRQQLAAHAAACPAQAGLSEEFGQLLDAAEDLFSRNGLHGVTIKDIANLCGVSIATVSRVVNNSPKGVGEKTVERIR